MAEHIFWNWNLKPGSDLISSLCDLANSINDSLNDWRDAFSVSVFVMDIVVDKAVKEDVVVVCRESADIPAPLRILARSEYRVGSVYR